MLERLAHGFTFRVQADRMVSASPGRVFRALGEVTADDLSTAHFGRAAAAIAAVARSRRSFDSEPLYAQMMNEGFSVLGSDPLREVVVGRLVSPLDLVRAPGRSGRRPSTFRTPYRGLGAALVIGISCAPEARGARLGFEARASAGNVLSRAVLALLWVPLRRRVLTPLVEAWLLAVQKAAEARP